MSDLSRPKLNLPELGRIGQICVVVRDLDEAVRSYWHNLGIGPWWIYTYQPPLVRRMTLAGRVQDYRMRLAFTPGLVPQFELVQPLEGDTIYQQFIDQHGEGLQHLGVFAHDFGDALRKAEAAGYDVIQSGHGFGPDGDGHYAYLSTEGDVSTIFELIDPPARRHPPEYIYPPEE
jgi:hypothetical protein